MPDNMLTFGETSLFFFLNKNVLNAYPISSTVLETRDASITHEQKNSSLCYHKVLERGKIIGNSRYRL